MRLPRQGVSAIRKEGVLREYVYPVVEVAYHHRALAFKTVEFRSDLGDNGLKLLLFQLKCRKIALELL